MAAFVPVPALIRPPPHSAVVPGTTASALISVAGPVPIFVLRHLPRRDRCRTHDPLAELVTTHTPPWPSEEILLGIARPGTAILTQCVPFQCTSFGRSRPFWRTRPATQTLCDVSASTAVNRIRARAFAVTCAHLVPSKCSTAFRDPPTPPSVL